MPLFMDSDVYKVLEAMAWEHQHGPLGALERFRQETGELLAAAQTPEGYLNSYVQVVKPGKRFEDPAMGHELYCAGHMFQAGVAEARQRGAGAPLGAVVERFAGYLVDVMAEKRSFVPGHPEIEMALVERYRQTGGAPAGPGRRPHRAPGAVVVVLRLVRARVLPGRRGGDQSRQGAWPRRPRPVLIERGGGPLHRDGPARTAGHLPQPVGGHDLGQDLSDRRSPRATRTRRSGTRFDFRLTAPTARRAPPSPTSCGTGVCALSRAKPALPSYIERALYNGFLASWSLDGENFFYVNPLQSRRGVQRRTLVPLCLLPAQPDAPGRHALDTTWPPAATMVSSCTSSCRPPSAKSWPAAGHVGPSVSTIVPPEGEVPSACGRPGAVRHRPPGTRRGPRTWWSSSMASPRGPSLVPTGTCTCDGGGSG